MIMRSIPHYQWDHNLKEDWYSSQEMNIMEKSEISNVKHNSDVICPCEHSQKPNTDSTQSYNRCINNTPDQNIKDTQECV